MGSWPGTDVRETQRGVRSLLAEDGLPYLPELPDRGPGADMVGRAAALLVDLHVDLQPMGWRFVDRPGRDADRARGLQRAADVAAFWLEGATAAFGQAKRLIRAGARRAFAENLADEARTIGASFDTPESHARVAAFAAASAKTTRKETA